MWWNQKIGLKKLVDKNVVYQQLKKIKNFKIYFGIQVGKVNKEKREVVFPVKKNALLYRQKQIMAETIKRFTYWEFNYDKFYNKNFSGSEDP